MPLASGRTKALYNALVSYLETETSAIDPTFNDWEYFTDAWNTAPKGSVVIGYETAPIYNANVSRLTLQRSIQLRVIVTAATETLAWASIYDWCDAIFLNSDSIMQKLRRQGTNGYFGGLQMAQSLRMRSHPEQESNGVKADAYCVYQWLDMQ